MLILNTNLIVPPQLIQKYKESKFTMSNIKIKPVENKSNIDYLSISKKINDKYGKIYNSVIIKDINITGDIIINEIPNVNLLIFENIICPSKTIINVFNGTIIIFVNCNIENCNITYIFEKLNCHNKTTINVSNGTIIIFVSCNIENCNITYSYY